MRKAQNFESKIRMTALFAIAEFYVIAFMTIMHYSILKDPRILAAAVEENRRVLTPLWLELLEEGKQDGSIKTEYTKELSELLPLINFWMMPTVFPATKEELHHRYRFVIEVLEHMGLPIFGDETVAFTDTVIDDIAEKGGGTP